jgi:hypothetical protein
MSFVGQILIRPNAASWFEWTKPARIVRIECSLLGGTVSNSPTSYYIQGTLWSSAYDDVRVVAHINGGTLSTKGLKGGLFDFTYLQFWKVQEIRRPLVHRSHFEAKKRSPLPMELPMFQSVGTLPITAMGTPYPSSTYPWRRDFHENLKSAKDLQQKITRGSSLTTLNSHQHPWSIGAKHRWVPHSSAPMGTLPLPIRPRWVPYPSTFSRITSQWRDLHR